VGDEEDARKDCCQGVSGVNALNDVCPDEHNVTIPPECEPALD
jgi:hypothetical protein